MQPRLITQIRLAILLHTTSSAVRPLGKVTLCVVPELTSPRKARCTVESPSLYAELLGFRLPLIQLHGPAPMSLAHWE